MGPFFYLCSVGDPMPEWSPWKILIGVGPNLRRGGKDLPRHPSIVYEVGIGREGEEPRPTYVGHGNERRLTIHRGAGWEHDVETAKTSTEMDPYVRQCLRRGYTIYYRYATTGAPADAEFEEARLRREWWNYPWNASGLPWDGARVRIKRRK
jgi:hypothetical protein